MATANLYISKDDKKKVNKTNLTSVKSNVDIVYKSDTTKLDTQIILNFDNENMKNINYIYLSDKNAYYFVVGSPVLMTGKRISYNLHEDVLMTGKDKLKSLKATVDRTQSDSPKIRNGYLVDDKFKSYAYEQITTKSFPSGINNDSIVLITVG